MSEDRQGWHRPPGSRKFHYFVGGGARSLCGNWGFAFHAELDAHKKGAPAQQRDDCKECWKKAEATP